MGIFDSLFGKKEKKSNDVKVNSLGEPLDKLIDGELPYGWVAHHENFVNKVQEEHNYFLQNWITSKNADSPIELYGALRSFILHMDKTRESCKQTGECHLLWYDECVAGLSYMSERKKELSELENNMDALMKVYNYKQRVKNFDELIIDKIKENDGILQKDFYRLFLDAPEIRAEVQSRLYRLSEEGKISRTKKGNTYILNLR